MQLLPTNQEAVRLPFKPHLSSVCQLTDSVLVLLDHGPPTMDVVAILIFPCMNCSFLRVFLLDSHSDSVVFVHLVVGGSVLCLYVTTICACEPPPHSVPSIIACLPLRWQTKPTEKKDLLCVRGVKSGRRAQCTAGITLCEGHHPPRPNPSRCLRIRSLYRTAP